MIDQTTFQQMMNNQQQMQLFQQQFQAFQQQFQGGFQNMPQDPQQAVMQNLQNGKMSQADFDRCRMMANQLTGKNY